MPVRRTLLALAAAALVVGCARSQPPPSGVGAAPVLPAPERRLFPRVDIAPAVGWADGEMPGAAEGLHVVAFATGLAHPRWLHVLPNGDVLVAESNAPAGKSGMRGLKGIAMKAVKKRAGAGVPSADRIHLLRDADGDGVAETRHVFLAGLHSPFGMALVGDRLYVANADAVVVVPYAQGDSRIDAPPRKIVDLPGAGDELNHHWTKSLLASRDGRLLYVGVGSNSNVAENGMAAERDRAAVLEVDPALGTRAVFADGLRNPVGLDWGPDGALWAVVNERDELGDDLVPDYLARIERGAFYGWPYSYWGAHVDRRVSPPRPDLVARARVPEYGLGNHVAPLGLAFNTSPALATWGPGAFIGLHGSWNRKPLSGYKVVFVPFAGARPTGAPRDVLTGFLDDRGRARGRPAGVAIARDGALLVADDVGNAVWRVMPTARR